MLRVHTDLIRFFSSYFDNYRWFRQKKVTSFQRQLNTYGFVRIAQGPDKGAYYHELFLRGRQELAQYIRRAARGQTPMSVQTQSQRDAPNLSRYPVCKAKVEEKVGAAVTRESAVHTAQQEAMVASTVAPRHQLSSLNSIAASGLPQESSSSPLRESPSIASSHLPAATRRVVTGNGSAAAPLLAPLQAGSGSVTSSTGTTPAARIGLPGLETLSVAPTSLSGMATAGSSELLLLPGRHQAREESKMGSPLALPLLQAQQQSHQILHERQQRLMQLSTASDSRLVNDPELRAPAGAPNLALSLNLSRRSALSDPLLEQQLRPLSRDDAPISGSTITTLQRQLIWQSQRDQLFAATQHSQPSTLAAAYLGLTTATAGSSVLDHLRGQQASSPSMAVLEQQLRLAQDQQRHRTLTLLLQQQQLSGTAAEGATLSSLPAVSSSMDVLQQSLTASSSLPATAEITTSNPTAAVVQSIEVQSREEKETEQPRELAKRKRGDRHTGDR